MADLDPVEAVQFPRDEPVDLGDKDAVKKRNIDIKRDAVERAQTIKAIMEHKHGRAFIFWLLDICGVNRNPFAMNALAMSYRSGEMNVGQQVLAEITTRETIDLYFQMLREGSEDA